MGNAIQPTLFETRDWCKAVNCGTNTICTTVAYLPPIRGLEKGRDIGLVAWPAPFSQSQASKSVFLFPEEHG